MSISLKLKSQTLYKYKSLYDDRRQMTVLREFTQAFVRHLSRVMNAKIIWITFSKMMSQKRIVAEAQKVLR